MTPNNAIKRIGIHRPFVARSVSLRTRCSRSRNEEKDKWDERDPLDSWEEEEMLHPSVV